MGSIPSHKTARPPPHMKELTSPRLLLRGARQGDAIELHKAFSDPEVMRYWSTLPHPDLATTEEWVQKMIQDRHNGTTDFIICLRSPGSDDEEEPRAIGHVGVWRDNEIGFLLSRDCWGRSLGKEALEMALAHLFLPGGFEDVVADVDPRNAASLGLLRRVGFEVYARREGTIQVGGVWLDSVYLTLSRETWRSLYGGGPGN